MTMFGEKLDNAIVAFKAVIENAEEDQRSSLKISAKQVADVLGICGINYRMTSWDGFGTRTRLWMFHDIAKDYIEELEKATQPVSWVANMGFRSSSFEFEELQAWIRIVKANRLKWLLARHKTWSAGRRTSSVNWDLNVSTIETVADINEPVIYVEYMLETLTAMKVVEETPIDKTSAAHAEEMWRVYIVEKEELLARFLEEKSDKKRPNGISFSDIIKKRTQMLADTVIEQTVVKQFEAFAERLDAAPVALVQRSWGWEMEIADAKGVDAVSGVEKGTDGSLRSYEGDSDNCECSCDECTYHECDCDLCSRYNDSPEHCGDSDCQSADSAEFRTVGPTIKSKHKGLETICKNLEAEGAEVNDTCGIHIHVYGADMSVRQIAQLVAIYMYLKPVLSAIAGRENNHYSQRMSVSNALRGMRKGLLSMSKSVEVNVNNLNGKGTVEFRQMSGTYDYKAINAWAWIVRGLTEAAHQGAQLRDFMHVNDLDQLLDVLVQKYSHTKQHENIDGIVYGSKMDKDLYKGNLFNYN